MSAVRPKPCVLKATDSAVCTDPQISVRVLRKAVNCVFREPVFRRVDGEFPFFPKIGAASVRANPQVALAVLKQRQDHIIRQPVLRGVGAELSILEPIQTTARRTDPEVSQPVGQKRRDVISAEGRRILLVEYGEAHTVKPDQALFRCQPEVPVGRLSNRGDRRLRQAAFEAPRLMDVLANGLFRIQAPGRARCEQEGQSRANEKSYAAATRSDSSVFRRHNRVAISYACIRCR